MAIAKEKLESLLLKAFPNADLEIIDTAMDQDHYSLVISHESFFGKTRIQQHKMVNEALRDCLGTTLHALQIKTIAK